MSIDADIDVQAVFPHLTYFSTNVSKLLMFLSAWCSPTRTNCTHLEILNWKPLRQKPKFLQYKQFPLMASSVNLSENLCLIPMDMWLWSGLTFPYVFCPLYCWGNPRCTSPCKGQLTWFRLLYSNSPKLRKTNCRRKQWTSFLVRGIVFVSHLCNCNYRKKNQGLFLPKASSVATQEQIRHFTFHVVLRWL